VNGITPKAFCFSLFLFSVTTSATHVVHFRGSIVKEACEIRNEKNKIISDCDGIINTIDYEEIRRNGLKYKKSLPVNVQSVSLETISKEMNLFSLNISYR